jgi:hypothetical protein
MVSGKEAIVFIPGIFGKEQDFYLNAYLIKGLTQNAVSARIYETGEALIEGCKGKRLEVKFHSGETKTIDVYEAFWADLLTTLSTQNLKDKVLRGTSLLLYWVFSGIWKTFKECPNLVGGFVTSLVLVTFWYYGTVAMVLTAIGQDPTFFGSKLPLGWSERLGQLGNAMGGWSVWLLISAFLTFIPINILVDLADFAKYHLQDAIDEGTGETIRAKLRKRILETLERVLNAKVYDRVTLLTHSYGAVIGTELLSNLKHPLPQPVRYITLGGPLKFLSLRATWIHEIIKGCLQNPSVESWTDYYSDLDWICTRTPIPGEISQKFESRKTIRQVSPWEMISGKSHSFYFYEKDVIEQLLDD